MASLLCLRRGSLLKIHVSLGRCGTLLWNNSQLILYFLQSFLRGLAIFAWAACLGLKRSSFSNRINRHKTRLKTAARNGLSVQARYIPHLQTAFHVAMHRCCASLEAVSAAAPGDSS